MVNLEELSRREIQALCKEHGIKAGGKTADLIAALSTVLKGPSEEAGSTVATAQQVAVADANGDGKITRSEARAMNHTAIPGDLDGDGKSNISCCPLLPSLFLFLIFSLCYLN
jgi:hypothetical protein